MSYNYKFTYLKNKLIELNNRMEKLKLKSGISKISLVTFNLMKPILFGKITGYEKRLLNYPSIVWYFANLCYTIEKFCYMILEDNYQIFLADKSNLYDYKRISVEDTYVVKLEEIDSLYKIYSELISKINDWIEFNNLTELSKKIIESVFHYNGFVNERIIEYYKSLNVQYDDKYYLNLPKDEIIRRLNFVDILGGLYKQGYNDSKIFIPDNQKPEFKSHVKSFKISDTVVTERMYLDFIENLGYDNQNLWTLDGWRWKQHNKIDSPMYWFKIGSSWYKKENNKNILIDQNENRPVMHISWYEAIAFCNWIGGRLPTEEEWEYVSTNRGKTNYPWGTDKPDFKTSSLDNENKTSISVKQIRSYKSLLNIEELIGNVHEWCLDSYLPYDNYTPDKINSSILYNNFDPRKRVLKGGSYASSSYFISPQSRLGAYPEERSIICGFRVVKDIDSKEDNFEIKKTSSSIDNKIDKNSSTKLSNMGKKLIEDLIKREIILKESLETITLIDDEDSDDLVNNNLYKKILGIDDDLEKHLENEDDKELSEQQEDDYSAEHLEEESVEDEYSDEQLDEDEYYDEQLDEDEYFDEQLDEDDYSAEHLEEDEYSDGQLEDLDDIEIIETDLLDEIESVKKLPKIDSDSESD